MANLPNLLSCLRLAMVPVLVGLAWTNHSRIFLVCFVFSLFTDLADGLLARRFKLATELGAKLDSWADLLTYAALPICGWWLRPDTVRQEGWWLAIGIGSYLAAIAVGFLKFRRLTSYHTWGAKASAVLVGVAVVAFFANGPGWLFRIAMPLVLLANLEEMAITAILPERRTNVASIFHALRVRRQFHASDEAEGVIAKCTDDPKAAMK